MSVSDVLYKCLIMNAYQMAVLKLKTIRETKFIYY